MPDREQAHATVLEKPRTPEATVTLRRTYAAPRELVFRSWTEPERLKQWWGPPGHATPEAEVDLRPGGRYRFTMRKLPDGPPFYLTGTYREVVPPEKLVYTWTWEEARSQVRDSIVTVRFHDLGATTEVVVMHDLLPTDEDRRNHTTGWTGCFDRLEQHLSTN